MPEHPGPGAYTQAPVPERYSGRYPQYQEDQELVAARKWIAELEHELAIHRRGAELLGDVVPPMALRGDHGDC